MLSCLVIAPNVRLSLLPPIPHTPKFSSLTSYLTSTSTPTPLTPAPTLFRPDRHRHPRLHSPTFPFCPSSGDSQSDSLLSAPKLFPLPPLTPLSTMIASYLFHSTAPSTSVCQIFIDDRHVTVNTTPRGFVLIHKPIVASLWTINKRRCSFPRNVGGCDSRFGPLLRTIATYPIGKDGHLRPKHWVRSFPVPVQS